MGSGICVYCHTRLSHDETWYWVDKQGGEGICAGCKIEKIENERDALVDKLSESKSLLEESLLHIEQQKEALQRLGPMPTLHEGNRVSIQLKREDYEFIQAARR